MHRVRDPVPLPTSKGIRVWPGAAYPLGATWTGEGTNFAIFAEHATAVTLQLFYDPYGTDPWAQVPLVRERPSNVWRAFLPDVRPGHLYGFRVDGPYQPSAGHRFNKHKLLIDPYAKAIAGEVRWDDALFGYTIGDPHGDLSFDARDSAAFVPKSVVVDNTFPWGDDRPLRTPWSHTLIYECHVKGLTKLHPDVPEHLRGTYLGLATDPVLEHLRALGVTAVELLPVHHRVSERALVQRGLSNYWGYNTIGFFAPDARFASSALGAQVLEFKSMVKALHRAGIEVIIDVVYNHTAEQQHTGPTLSLRGLDGGYYRPRGSDRRYCEDVTGCGNTVDTRHPRALQLVLDSLRYWVAEMHVDGFRFDLAPALAREPHEFNRDGKFFTVIQQDPVLSQVKLIAEPWDLGPGGYQVGNFPSGWTEWNGRYRDAMRSFWRGDRGKVPELASRLAGNADIYAWSAGVPPASINFITSHDGFTLADLVSYERKHNEANKEDNRDGADHNLSRNFGVEGPTDDPAIATLRLRMIKNFLATLALSQGVPMLVAGDEMGRTQLGNNNAYCQDNEVSWVSWELDDAKHQLLEFTRHVFAVRRANPVLRRRSFFTGSSVEDGVKDVTWIRPDGREMVDVDWRDAKRQTLGMLIAGLATDEVDEHGRPVLGATLLVLVNAGPQSRSFRMPQLAEVGVWRQEIDSARGGQRLVRTKAVHVAGQSVMLLSYGRWK